MTIVSFLNSKVWKYN